MVLYGLRPSLYTLRCLSHFLLLEIRGLTKARELERMLFWSLRQDGGKEGAALKNSSITPPPSVQYKPTKHRNRIFSNFALSLSVPRENMRK